MTVRPPNVLYIVWDDAGIAMWNAFGGLFETPSLSWLARRGLRFTQWHTPALSSPTRCCLLTGREYHDGSAAWAAGGAHKSREQQSVTIPPDSGTLAETLRGAGYRTYCVGKWHLSPAQAGLIADSRRTWPLARGFDRYYGFLGSQTSPCCPDLVYDNQHVDPPYPPEDGYHLNGDLADMAMEFIRDGQRTAPAEPWLCYLSFGQNGIPQVAPREWADACRGRFDLGYDRYREAVLANMKRLGVVPDDTGLAPADGQPARGGPAGGHLARPWRSLSEEQRGLSRQFAESSAALCCYTDYQVGRLIWYLQESRQLEDTIVVVCSANAMSPPGSGSPGDGLLPGAAGSGHCPAGWAWAFRTPYNMTRQYSLGGSVPSPLIISWPRETAGAGGGVRDQYHHAVDIVPTILDCAGVGPPRIINGCPQAPMHGVSMRYTFTAPGAPSTRHTQLYEMPGAHAIYQDGWKAVAGRRVTGGPRGAGYGGAGYGGAGYGGAGHGAAGTWELCHVAADRAEVRNVAAQHPERAAELAALWQAAAARDTGLVPEARLRAGRPGSGLAGSPGRPALVPGRVPVADAARRPAASGGRPGLAGG